MKWGRVILVILGAIIITALGIDAADTLQGSEGTLLARVIRTSTGPCPSGMVPVSTISTVSCVDAYEASPSPECPVSVPEQIQGTQRNLEARGCSAVPKEGVRPWSFVTRDQAMQLCARRGLRLPTPEEWYALSLGMADVERSCNVSSGSAANTGTYASCSSPEGVYDLVGNVWEWVSGDVKDGVYESTELPLSGYVTQVDGGGMPVVVSSDPQELFGKDYFWSEPAGIFAMVRGGYYSSKEDAGLYTVHAGTLPTTASAGIGFRCLK